MNPSLQMKWQIGTIGQFYECGESNAIYFDTASGNTHLLSDFAAYLIQKLDDSQGALDIGQIIELVANDIEPEELVELSQAIPGMLEELVALDIIATG